MNKDENVFQDDLNSHHKTRQRVRDSGEVFTQQREIDAMLDLIPDAFLGIEQRFLEPASGNGNFLVSILERKIATISEERHGGTRNWYEYALMTCLTSIYAVDIDSENVNEARTRLQSLIDAAHSFVNTERTPRFSRAVSNVLEKNILQADTLKDADSILFIEYTPVGNEQFARELCYLDLPEMDLFFVPPPKLSTVHYSEL